MTDAERKRSIDEQNEKVLQEALSETAKKPRREHPSVPEAIEMFEELSGSPRILKRKPEDIGD